MEEEKYTSICERLARIEVLLEQNAKENKEIETTLKDHEVRLQQCETSSDRKDATKWQTIMDYIFKFILAGFVGYLAVKLGFNN